MKSNYDVIVSDAFLLSLDPDFVTNHKRVHYLKVDLISYLDQLRLGLIDYKSVQERCGYTFPQFKTYVKTSGDEEFLDIKMQLAKDALQPLDTITFLFELENAVNYVKNILFYQEANRFA